MLEVAYAEPSGGPVKVLRTPSVLAEQSNDDLRLLGRSCRSEVIAMLHPQRDHETKA